MSQSQQIKKHLESGKTLTAMEALKKFKCFRLASRVHDLKNQGLDIKSGTVSKGGKIYGVYWI